MLKSLAKSVLGKFGLEVRRVASQAKSFPANAFDAQRVLLDGIGVTKPTIFDIGAYKGETVEEYRSRFPDSTIYCFEPFPDSVKVLNERYNSDPAIHVVPLAVADKPGQRTFYVNDFDATNSLLPRPETARRYYPKRAGPKSTMQVTVTTIDEFTHSHRVESIHVLKFDIQGGELMALQGAIETLKEKHVPIIYAETMFIPHYEGNPLFYELWSFLANFRYTLFDVYHLHRATNGQLRYGDALFVSPKIREAVINRYQEEP